MSETKNWRFCVVGNIISQHIDADGKLLYGSKAFSGGTKVYIDDLWWKDDISYEYKNTEERRILIMIMDMLFEEFYPHHYVLVDVTW